jgi:hypothetical protein
MVLCPVKEKTYLQPSTVHCKDRKAVVMELSKVCRTAVTKQKTRACSMMQVGECAVMSFTRKGTIWSMAQSASHG